MGYKPKQKTYKLVFEDEELAGLTVKVKSASVGTLLEITGLLKGLGSFDPDNITADDLPHLNKLFELFSDALVSWNVEEDVKDEETGEVVARPVPPTLEGVKSQDADFIMGIISSWAAALASSASVPAPLAPRSSDGGRSLEASMPMETR